MSLSMRSGLPRNAFRAARQSRCNISSRSSSTTSQLYNSASRPIWLALGASIGIPVAAWTHHHGLMPELQVLPVAHAEEPASQDTYLDPTSSIPFPVTITTPSGKKLKLVGTGVRTVSFLGIKVYTGGFYVDEATLARLSSIPGFQSGAYTSEKLLPPFPKDPAAGLYGEALVSKLLQQADVTMVIVPLRNTNLPHLRDGFARGLTARLKLPHVSSAMSEADGDATAAALTEMKGFFPARTLPKGSPLELHFDASRRSILFQMRAKPDGPPEVLGTLTHPVLARELVLSYFSDTLETSPELRKSVAMGLGGEPRLPVA